MKLPLVFILTAIMHNYLADQVVFLVKINTSAIFVSMAIFCINTQKSRFA